MGMKPVKNRSRAIFEEVGVETPRQMPVAPKGGMIAMKPGGLHIMLTGEPLMASNTLGQEAVDIQLLGDKAHLACKQLVHVQQIID